MNDVLNYLLFEMQLQLKKSSHVVTTCVVYILSLKRDDSKLPSIDTNVIIRRSMTGANTCTSVRDSRFRDIWA